MGKNILIVDDDPHIREVLRFALSNAGMTPVEAKDGLQALALFKAQEPDLIVLDVSMPEMDGLEVCKAIRKTSDVPILFLSSRDEEIDRVLGLEIGGDDYVTKPFSPRELVARINVILKRVAGSAKTADPEDEMRRGGLVLSCESHQVRWNDREVVLTGKEFAILKGLMRFPKKVFDRDAILDQAYDVNIHVSDRTIDSHIRRIRKKFADVGCDAVVDTVHGVGYRLGLCE